MANHAVGAKVIVKDFNARVSHFVACLTKVIGLALTVTLTLTALTKVIGLTQGQTILPLPMDDTRDSAAAGGVPTKETI